MPGGNSMGPAPSIGGRGRKPGGIGGGASPNGGAGGIIKGGIGGMLFTFGLSIFPKGTLMRREPAALLTACVTG